MTDRDMEVAGAGHRAMAFSDHALDQQIQALDLVIAYLSSRGDAALVLYPLIQEREAFLRMQEARSERCEKMLVKDGGVRKTTYDMDSDVFRDGGAMV